MMSNKLRHLPDRASSNARSRAVFRTSISNLVTQKLFVQMGYCARRRGQAIDKGTSFLRGSYVFMKPHVLILEDDFLMAANLEEVQEVLHAKPIGVSTVVEALQIIPDGIEFAVLDIEVRDRQSYQVARKLKKCEIPFIFVSGNDIKSLPEDLKDVPRWLPSTYSGGGIVICRQVPAE